MSAKRLTIYPFSSETVPLALYLEQLNPSYKISFLVSPTGLSLGGKDAAWADNRPDIGRVVTEDIKDALLHSDALLVPPGELTDELHSRSLMAMNQALDLGKEVNCALTLPEELKKELEKRSIRENVHFRYCVNENDSLVDGTTSQELPLALYAPDCPVIFIGGLLERGNTFEMLLALTDALQKKNFSVAAVGCPSFCEFLGMHSLPGFMREHTLGNDLKVKILNMYIRNLMRKEKPDILLVQLPGGMMKYNAILTNGFGIDSYLISQALQPDYSICCTFYQTYGKKFAEQTSHTFLERFGFEIDCFHMSNFMVDLSDSYQQAELIYTHIGSEQVDQSLQQLKASGNFSFKCPAFNILNPKGKQECIAFILDKLLEKSIDKVQEGEL